MRRDATRTVKGVERGRNWLSFAAVLLALVALGCGGGQEESVASPASRGDAPLEFSFGDVEGNVVFSQAQRGRVTALLFATTFDVGSQSQAEMLEDAVRVHSPRINGIVVLLEPPNHIELARAYRDTLGLHYPVVLADPETLAGRGMFGGLRIVPAWLILDADGRVVAAYSGTLGAKDFEELLKKAE